MPIERCSSGGNPGYRFGDSGKCYTYTPGDTSSRRTARNRAVQQERAIRASGYKEAYRDDDMKKELPALAEAEQKFADALLDIVEEYGKLQDGDEKGIWVGYIPASENEDADIGVNCANCYFHESDNVCKIIVQAIEPNGMCRLAAIPPGLVDSSMDEDDDSMDDDDEDLGDHDDMNKNDPMLNKSTKEFHLAQVNEHLKQAELHSKMAETAASQQQAFISDGRKQDLIEILKDHIQEYGNFSRTVEEIVEIISES